MKGLVLLCGIPGAGKSTLALRLKRHWESLYSTPACMYEFDALLPKWCDKDAYKQEKTAVITQIEAHLQELHKST